MSDYCYDLVTMEHIVSQAETMDRMLERVGVDPNSATRVEDGMAWYEARMRCLDCQSIARCRAWLAGVSSGGNLEAPEFCPNASFFRDFNSDCN
ncbi:MAG: DUF6455 family protein [Hyphomicrobiaceae bacterium]